MPRPMRSPASCRKRSKVRERRGRPPAARYRLAWVPASAHRACSGRSLPDRKPRGCRSGYQGEGRRGGQQAFPAPQAFEKMLIDEGRPVPDKTYAPPAVHRADAEDDFS